MRREPLIFIVSGPSGSGKTTLIKSVLFKKDFKNNLVRIKSFTTRPLRSDESGVKDYFFVSDAEFKRRQRKREFLESVRYLGYYYGTPRQAVWQALRKNKDLLLCVDVRGKTAIEKVFKGRTVSIFVLPSKEDVEEALLRRLARRSTEETHQVRARIGVSRREIWQAKNYNYIIVNENLKKAAGELARIIATERKRAVDR